jgi:hypothetical protein
VERHEPRLHGGPDVVVDPVADVGHFSRLGLHQLDEP